MCPSELCSICGERESETRDGLCKKCLRAWLKHENEPPKIPSDQIGRPARHWGSYDVDVRPTEEQP